MPLIKDGQPGVDPYTDVPDDTPLPMGGPVIVSLARLEDAREQVFGRNDPVGVVLRSHESPMQIAPDDLKRLSLVVLEFPKFRDGRGFSWARILRTRLSFTGDIRARGNFLRDQLFFMVRCGINSFAGDARITPDAVRAALATFAHVYQPAADGRQSIIDARHG